jgi:large subunit ribosomal protein L32
MAVPKKKISPSRGGMRKGGNGAYKTTLPNVVIDKTTGEYKLPHHISLDGYYNGKKIIADKKKKQEKQEKQEISSTEVDKTKESKKNE